MIKDHQDHKDHQEVSKDPKDQEVMKAHKDVKAHKDPREILVARVHKDSKVHKAQVQEVNKVHKAWLVLTAQMALMDHKALKAYRVLKEVRETKVKLDKLDLKEVLVNKVHKEHLTESHNLCGSVYSLTNQHPPMKSSLQVFSMLKILMLWEI